MVCTESNGRVRWVWSTTPRTASGSGCCVRTDSTSRSSTSCVLPNTVRRTRATTSSRSSGRRSGLARISGSLVNVADAPPSPPLLLASTSPQRKAILEQLHVPFDVVAPKYEEHDPPEADASRLVRDHALAKARSGADEAGERPGARGRPAVPPGSPPSPEAHRR